MRELIYTLLDLEWEYRNRSCDFCSSRYGKVNNSVNQIVTRHKTTNKLIAVDCVCKDCKKKFLSNQILKCERCGRLQTELSASILCRCIRHNEDLEEKELFSVPYESQSTFYERQINDLRTKLTTAEITIEEEREAHEDFMEKSEEWSKRQKQELLDRIKELEEENKRLKGQNQKIVPENLINKIKSYEKEIAELRKQLEQVNQQLAQIEVPSKRFKTS